MAIKRALIVSDLHSPFHDIKSLSAVKKLMKDISPHYFIVNGDAYDFYGISRFDKNPERTIGGLQRELDIGFIMFKWLLDGFKGKAYFIEGNHEDRWNRFLASNANLYSLRSLNLLDNMRIKELGITYEKTHLILHGLLIKHGTYFNLHTANKEMTVEGVSGTSGHIHRVQLLAKTFRDKQIEWCTTGHMADVSQLDYLQAGKRVTNHQQAFILVDLDETHNLIQFYPIILKNHSFIWNGKLYSPMKSYINKYNSMVGELD
jgi:predicted phosphodiesterase